MALQRRKLWNRWAWLRHLGPPCWGAESSSHPALLRVPSATGSVKCRAMGHWPQAASKTRDTVHCLRQVTGFFWKSLKNWLVYKKNNQQLLKSLDFVSEPLQILPVAPNLLKVFMHCLVPGAIALVWCFFSFAVLCPQPFTFLNVNMDVAPSCTKPCFRSFSSALTYKQAINLLARTGGALSQCYYICWAPNN